MKIVNFFKDGSILVSMSHEERCLVLKAAKEAAHDRDNRLSPEMKAAFPEDYEQINAERKQILTIHNRLS